MQATVAVMFFNPSKEEVQSRFVWPLPTTSSQYALEEIWRNERFIMSIAEERHVTVSKEDVLLYIAHPLPSATTAPAIALRFVILTAFTSLLLIIFDKRLAQYISRAAVRRLRVFCFLVTGVTVIFYLHVAL